MTVSPAAENYLYDVMGPYYASLALGRSEYVPSPFEDVERGYFLFAGSGAPPAPRAETPEDYTLDESSDRKPDQPTTTGTQSKLSGTLGKIQTAIDAYITDRVEAYMAFPEAINPLTGTSRVTGLSPAVAAMMPGFFGPLVEAGYKANMANLSMLAGMSQKSDRFSTGLMGNQLVGVQPTDTTLGGIVFESLGFNVEGYTLSGNVGSFTNVDQSEYEDAVIASLLYNPPTAYNPGRAVAMGLDPQVTYSQVNITPDVVAQLGIDPFGPNPGLATDAAFQAFADDKSGSGVPGSIVGSYDPAGNWQPVTNPYSGYAFSNMMSGLTKMQLEASGFSFFERPGGQFEVYSPDTGFGPGGGIGSPFDNTADSQANQFDKVSTPSGPSFDDSSLGKGSGGGGDDKDFGGGFGGYGGDPDEGGYGAGRAMGGRIGYAPGGNVTNGFVNKDPDSVTEKQSIADNRLTSVKERSFIVNQPTNEKHKLMLDGLIAKAKKKAKKPKDAPMVDVALSDGERLIEPEVVAEIEKMKGESFLDDLNDKGKPEVRRREKKYGSGVGVNEGGFINMEVVDQPYGGIDQLSEIYDQYKTRFKSPEIARKKAADLFKSLPAEDALALVMMGEASILGDEGMRAVGHVILNRVDSDYEDFSKLNSIYDVVTQRTRSGKGIYQFNAVEPTTLRKTLKDITTTDYGKDKYQRLRNDAEEILAGVQDDFTQGSLFFWNPETSTDKSFRKKVESGEWVPTTETITNLGKHQYLIPESIRQLPVN